MKQEKVEAVTVGRIPAREADWQKAIQDGEAQSSVLIKMHNDAMTTANKYKRQRDELLAALKSAFDVLQREGPNGFDAAQERMKSAIAKVEAAQ